MDVGSSNESISRGKFSGSGKSASSLKTAIIPPFSPDELVKFSQKCAFLLMQ